MGSCATTTVLSSQDHSFLCNPIKRRQSQMKTISSFLGERFNERFLVSSLILFPICNDYKHRCILVLLLLTVFYQSKPSPMSWLQISHNCRIGNGGCSLPNLPNKHMQLDSPSSFSAKSPEHSRQTQWCWPSSSWCSSAWTHTMNKIQRDFYVKKLEDRLTQMWCMSNPSE